MIGLFLTNNLYIGARDWEARQRKASEEARRIQDEARRKAQEAETREQQQAILRKAEESLQGLTSGSKYNVVTVGDIKEGIRMLEREEQPQHYGYSPGKSTFGKPTAVGDVKIAGRQVPTTAQRQQEVKEFQFKQQEKKKFQAIQLQRERQRRIEETQAKIRKKAEADKPKDTFPASQKFIDLYQAREQEIQTIRKQEAGKKAYDQWVQDIKKSREEQRKPIVEAKRIISQKPSLKKAKEYYTLLATKPQEFETARAEIRKERILAGDKAGEWQLSAVKPASYARQKPVQTAFIIGAVSVPFLGLASAVPVVGKVVTSKLFGVGLASAYGVAKGYEIGKKVREQPLLYKRSSSILELGSEPVLEVGAFSIGAGASRAVGAGGKWVIAKGKQIKLTKAVKGKPATEARDIVLSRQVARPRETGLVSRQQIIKGKKGARYPLAKTTKAVSTKLRVKELRGFEATREITIKGGKLKSAGKYTPKYSKSYLIEPKDIQQPEAMILRTKGYRVGKITPPKVKTVTGKEIVKRIGPYEKGVTGKYFITQKQLKEFSIPRKFVAKYDVGYKGKPLKEIAFSSGRFSPTQLQNYGGSAYKKIPAKQPRLEYWKAKLTGKPTPSKVTYQYKLTGPDVVYKPVISESGEALGTYKVNLKTKKIEFITAGRGKARKINPFKKLLAKPPQPTGVETTGGTGQVTIQKLEKPFLVAEGVKVSAKTSKVKAESIFSPLSKSKFKSEFKSDVKKDSYYKVFEELKRQAGVKPRKATRITPISKVDLAMGNIIAQKQYSAQAKVPAQIVSPAQAITPALAQEPISIQEVVPAQDVVQAQAVDTVPAKKLITEQITQQSFKPGDPYKYKPPEPPRPPPPSIPLWSGGRRDFKPLFSASVRRRGIFRPIGKFRTAKEAFLKSKVAVERSASASLKVEGPGALSKAWGVLPRRKFRASKREPGIFIQRRRFRISSAGEKKEITFKGLLFQKVRRKKDLVYFEVIKMPMDLPKPKKEKYGEDCTYKKTIKEFGTGVKKSPKQRGYY